MKEKFMEWINKVALFVDTNKYLDCIKKAFTIAMPFILIGSFGNLFKYLLTSKTTGLAQWIPALSQLQPAFDMLNFATITCMAVPIVYLVGECLGKSNKMPTFYCGVLSLTCYLAVSPSVVSISLDDGTVKTAVGLASKVLGAQGLFVGILVGIFSTMLFTFLMGIDKLKIKMPDSVPSQIATSFNTLIPCLLTVAIFAVGGQLFKMATGMYINDVIYSMIQVPLEAAFQAGYGIIALQVFSQILWVFGVHGGTATQAIKNPIMASALASNIEAANAGQVPVQMYTQSFQRCFQALGGAGMVIGFAFALLLFSKREDYRSLTKIALVPCLCGISEPFVFGIPLVLNPTFAIPFILAPVASSGVAMFLFNIGFLTANTVDTPFSLPILINAPIAYGWQGIVAEVIVIVLSTAIYAPFVLISNKQVPTENA